MFAYLLTYTQSSQGRLMIKTFLLASLGESKTVGVDHL